MAQEDDLLRRLLARAEQAAEAAILLVFGQAWRGGKLDASYLTGTIPATVLGRRHSDPATSSTFRVHLNANSDTGVLSIVFSPAYAGGVTPTVVVSSSDPDRPAAQSNASHTGFDITVSQRTLRREPLAVQGEAVTIPAGQSQASKVVTYPGGVTFAPVYGISCASRDLNYRALVTAVTTTTFTLTVIHQPVSTLSSGGPSDNETNTTTTVTDSTGGTSNGHTHSIPAGTDALGGTSGAQSADHTHGVGSHSHAMKLHTHGVDTATSVGGSNVVISVDYAIFGVRDTAALDVDVSWIADGS